MHSKKNIVFDGARIDAGCSRSSVISIGQYRAYCSNFRAPIFISQKGAKSVNGLGGKAIAIVAATIPIPFKKLGIIADVRFQVVNENIPSLLSMKDIY